MTRFGTWAGFPLFGGVVGPKSPWGKRGVISPKAVSGHCPDCRRSARKAAQIVMEPGSRESPVTPDGAERGFSANGLAHGCRSFSEPSSARRRYFVCRGGRLKLPQVCDQRRPLFGFWDPVEVDAVRRRDRRNHTGRRRLPGRT